VNEYPEHLYWEVAVPEDTDGELVADCLQMCVESLVRPRLPALGLSADLRTATDGAEVSVERPSSPTVLLPLSDDSLEKQLRAVRSGEASGFGVISMGFTRDGWTDATRMVELGLDVVGADYPGAASTITVRVSPALFPNGFSREEQEAWVKAACETARVCRAATGFLMFGAKLYAESPFDYAIGRDWVDSLRECSTWVPGAYWGNVISEQHIDRLGGWSAVETAPCTRIEDLSDGSRKLAYLQVSDDVFEMTEEDLTRLADFLAPVLPSGDPHLAAFRRGELG
jgi:hypothetical protein